MSEEIKDNISVADEVIAMTAEVSASRVKGVASMATGITDSIRKNILRSEVHEGVRISREGEKQALVIDIHVNIIYGYRIPEVAWEIQETVRNDVLQLVGETAKSVNIFVEGVEFVEEEPETDNNTEGEDPNEKK